MTVTTSSLLPGVADAVSALVADSVMPEIDFGAWAETFSAASLSAVPVPMVDFGPMLDAVSVLVADSVMPEIDFGAWAETFSAASLSAVPVPMVDFGPMLDAVSVLVADSRIPGSGSIQSTAAPLPTLCLASAGPLHVAETEVPEREWDTINLYPLDARGHFHLGWCWVVSVLAGGGAWFVNAWMDGNTSPTDPAMVVITVYLALRQPRWR